MCFYPEDVVWLSEMLDRLGEQFEPDCVRFDGVNGTVSLQWDLRDDPDTGDEEGEDDA